MIEVALFDLGGVLVELTGVPTLLSWMGGRIGPDTEAFEHVILNLGRAPKSILFLDDNQLNVDAALSLGINAFRVQGTEEARIVMKQIGALRHPGFQHQSK